MTDVDKRIQNMIAWCDLVAVKWKDGGTKKVPPRYKYNNHNCTRNGGYCKFCKPSRKKAYFCNSYVIAALVHGFGLKDKNFLADCKLWKGHGCGGMMRRDFNPAVKKGIFEVVKGISKKHPIYCNTKAEIQAAEEILRPMDVLIIGRGKKHKICHTAIWYGNGLITECAGDAGCCTRTAKKIDRGQGRCIVKVYRKTGQSEFTPIKKSKKLYKVINKKGMNIRSGPGIKYKKVGHIAHGAKVGISKTSGRWGYIPALSGWVCIKGKTKRYLKKV